MAVLIAIACIIALSNGSVSFESSYVGSYIGRLGRHNYLFILPEPSSFDESYEADTSFKFSSALNERAGYVSIESTHYPGHFFRHQGKRLKLLQNDDSQIFKDDASFKIKNALNDRYGYVSFESSNFPGFYIRQRNDYSLWIDTLTDTQDFNEAASFQMVYKDSVICQNVNSSIYNTTDVRLYL